MGQIPYNRRAAGMGSSSPHKPHKPHKPQKPYESSTGPTAGDIMAGMLLALVACVAAGALFVLSLPGGGAPTVRPLPTQAAVTAHAVGSAPATTHPRRGASEAREAAAPNLSEPPERSAPSPESRTVRRPPTPDSAPRRQVRMRRRAAIPAEPAWVTPPDIPCDPGPVVMDPPPDAVWVEDLGAFPDEGEDMEWDGRRMERIPVWRDSDGPIPNRIRFQREPPPPVVMGYVDPPPPVRVRYQEVYGPPCGYGGFE